MRGGVGRRHCFCDCKCRGAFMNWQDFPAYEFNIDGTFTPADSLRWPVDAADSEMFVLTGWRFADRLGEREELRADPVSIVVYREDEAGEVLVDLVALGIRAWLVCRSLPAYLLLLHDYLRPLGMLNQREAT